MKAHTLEEIREKMVEVDENIEILSKYSKKAGITKIRYRIYIKCKCKICGNEWDSDVSNLLTGYGCMVCSGNDKNTLLGIKKELKEINPNIEILSDCYINNGSKLKCKCLIDGYEWKANWRHLSQGTGCPICGGTKKLSIPEVEKMLGHINSNIKIIGGTYETARSNLRCKCQICNNEWEANWSHLKRGHGCPICALENRSGEHHPRYNPNLTDEERENGRNMIGESYTNWRRKVFEKDKYTCQCCGDNKGGNLTSHHLDGYNWAKDKRIDVDNGVTLCKLCHGEFHKIYKYGNNTKEQFKEFMINITKKEVI